MGSVAWASVALSANLPLQPFNSRRVRGEATAVFTPRTRPAVSGPAELPLCPAYFQPFRSRSPCVKCHISTFLLGYQSYSLSTALLNSRSLFSIARLPDPAAWQSSSLSVFFFFFTPSHLIFGQVLLWQEEQVVFISRASSDGLESYTEAPKAKSGVVGTERRGGSVTSAADLGGDGSTVHGSRCHSCSGTGSTVTHRFTARL